MYFSFFLFLGEGPSPACTFPVFALFQVKGQTEVQFISFIIRKYSNISILSAGELQFIIQTVSEVNNDQDRKSQENYIYIYICIVCMY